MRRQPKTTRSESSVIAASHCPDRTRKAIWLSASYGATIAEIPILTQASNSFLAISGLMSMHFWKLSCVGAERHDEGGGCQLRTQRATLLSEVGEARCALAGAGETVGWKRDGAGGSHERGRPLARPEHCEPPCPVQRAPALALILGAGLGRQRCPIEHHD